MVFPFRQRNGEVRWVPDLSSQYQVLATQRADELNLARIHLDVLHWRKEE